MEQIQVNGFDFLACQIPTPHGKILIIRGRCGMLACGYLNVETAEKLSDALAIVTGVKTYEDMLNARIQKVSSEAAACGVTPGMTGREALLHFC